MAVAELELREISPTFTTLSNCTRRMTRLNAAGGRYDLGGERGTHMFDNKTAEAAEVAFDLTAKRNTAMDKVVGGDARQDAASAFEMARALIRDGHKAKRIRKRLMLILMVSLMLNVAILVIIL